MFVKEMTVQSKNLPSLLATARTQRLALRMGKENVQSGFHQHQSKGGQKHIAHNIVRTYLNNLSERIGGRMFL